MEHTHLAHFPKGLFAGPLSSETRQNKQVIRLEIISIKKKDKIYLA